MTTPLSRSVSRKIRELRFSMVPTMDVDSAVVGMIARFHYITSEDWASWEDPRSSSIPSGDALQAVAHLLNSTVSVLLDMQP